MDSYLNTFLFGIYPYIALAVFLVGSLSASTASSTRGRATARSCLRRGQLRLGSNLFHVGILGIFGGHFVGLLTPMPALARARRRGLAKQLSRSSPAGSSA